MTLMLLKIAQNLVLLVLVLMMRRRSDTPD